MALLSCLRIAAAAAAVALVTGCSSLQFGDDFGLKPFDVIGSLPPAPQPGSAIAEDDLKHLAAARAAGPERLQEAINDARLHRYAQRVIDILKKDPMAASMDFDLAEQVLKRLQKIASQSVQPTKRSYDRERPWFAHGGFMCSDSRVMGRKGDSYPSGHAAHAWLASLFFAELVPTSRKPLEELAERFSYSREVCLAHWHSDVLAGRRAAELILAQILFDREAVKKLDARLWGRL